MAAGTTSFSRFYETWFDQLRQLMHQLSTARKPPTNQDELSHLTSLVQKVVTHYGEYYKMKSAVAERDVLSVFAAPWATSLERSLHWIAGWRPTTLFHLVYTESSILFESHIYEILKGRRIGDLGDLSPTQFRMVSELQCETVKEENAITDELSEWQDGAGELVVESNTNFEDKIKRLSSVVRKADDLRLITIGRLVEILTPQQSVEFLIAAAELQFGIRGWGINQDRLRLGIKPT